ncbi:bifunctional folylpolyglutamate synthase/dihydrofolate synthase [Natronoglycomyces albus]|uniref:tetrahydrofolate synthase n=1 Tax=Natronoglycomyces albus TaxID=2811108 RepID=A0A895XMR1_9ACTN|nr:bifunctional folylpolyglutamate synthase/dihydrofolate synthase [Natronoglycomyces albus]
MDFTLDRIKALLDLLGEPQKSFRAIHITGTNGKTSTARMIDNLLRAHGLRTGRFTSPHLETVAERISIDGEPIDTDSLVHVYNEVAPLADMIDAQFEESLTYFDMTVALAMAAFADAPVDVGVIEVGLGGETDSTNVLGAEVAVITPIGLDHTKFLGDTIGQIATMKAGIVHEGATLVTAHQDVEAMEPLLRRAAAMKAELVAQGRAFDVVERFPAVGGQQLTIRTKAATYENIFLPLHGEHQAQNAAVALAAVETLLGAGTPKALDGEVIAEAFAQASSPGRLEVVRTAPTIVLDAAHNPAGMTATVAGLQESFSFRKLVAVVGILGDKDAEEMLDKLEPIVDEVVITRPESERAQPPARLAVAAREVFGDERVFVVPYLPDALERAVELVEAEEAAYGGGGVLVTGSVFTVSDARRLLVKDD